MWIVIIVDREVLGNYFLMEQTEVEVKGNTRSSKNWPGLECFPVHILSPASLLFFHLSFYPSFFPHSFSSFLPFFFVFFSNSLANLDSFCNMDLEENYRWESWCCGIIHFSSTVFLFIIPLSAKIKYNVL